MLDIKDVKFTTKKEPDGYIVRAYITIQAEVVERSNDDGMMDMAEGRLVDILDRFIYGDLRKDAEEIIYYLENEIHANQKACKLLNELRDLIFRKGIG